MKTCTNCNGAGEITKDDDFAGDGKWGSSTGVQYWQEECEQCNGKAYLELKEVWQ